MSNAPSVKESARALIDSLKTADRSLNSEPSNKWHLAIVNGNTWVIDEVLSALIGSPDLLSNGFLKELALDVYVHADRLEHFTAFRQMLENKGITIITPETLFNALTSTHRKPFEYMPDIWRRTLIGSEFHLVDQVLVLLMKDESVDGNVLQAVAHEVVPYSQYLTKWKVYETYVLTKRSKVHNPDMLLTSHLVEGQSLDLSIEAVYPGSRYDITGFYTGGNRSAESPDGFSSNFSRLALIFQNGPIPEVGPNGITIEALLAVCEHRLAGFQVSPFACEENQTALDHISAALAALKGRTVRRMAHSVEGTHTPEPPKLPTPPPVRVIYEGKP